jgi:hypothetical protein
MARDNINLRMLLNVEDFASLASSTLNDAANEVSQVFIHAGIRVVWVYGTGRAHASSDGHPHVWVQILNHEMAERKSAAERIPSTVLGQAAREVCRISIFNDRVAALDNPLAEGAGHGVLLGRVIAHEIGHLVLPPESHSGAGIMRGTFDLRPKMVPLFTVEQEEAIRLTLLDRRPCVDRATAVPLLKTR